MQLPYLFILPCLFSSCVAQTLPGNISPEWRAAYTKAQAAVAGLSVSQKVALVSGTSSQNPCTGNIAQVASVSAFRGLCLQDGPLGIRLSPGHNTTAFPAAITVASTFNRDIMRQRGVAMGEEFRAKGRHIALGPMMNLMRIPAAGRNWEGFGADPFLSGEAAFETITGIQSQGVQATAKHFVANEQEHLRMSSSSNVDDRTMHELYAHPFLRSVQADLAAVMCSYNLVNGTFACENDKIQNGILKQEYGFPGYIMSDWGATHSTSMAANNGLDMQMPDAGFFGSALVSAVNAGQVSQARVTDMAVRVLAAWYLLGQDANFPAPNDNAPVTGHGSLVRTIAAAGTVLLKNSGNLLPLSTPRTVAVIGTGAGPNTLGLNGCTQCVNGVLGQGWGSGIAPYPYMITPVDAITAKVRSVGGTVTAALTDTNLATAATAATGKDAALVFIAASSGEGSSPVEGNAGDRANLLAWHGGDALVQRVASVNRNTIVVVNSVGPIVMEAWIQNPNVSAVVWSNLPGQEAGNSVTDILFGAVNPSGRLPYTIARFQSDYPAQIVTVPNGNATPIPYAEGLFIDYRHFDRANISPRFEFGFGLSYTTFAYSGLSISGSIPGAGSPGPRGPGASLDAGLHRNIVTVTFTVANTGGVAGTEIPQLYLTPPSGANAGPRALKGFTNIQLSPSASSSVTIELSRYDFSFWDVVTQTWVVPAGQFRIQIGASSRDIRLTGTITA